MVLKLVVLKELKNKKNKILQKNVRITNTDNKDAINFDTVNDIYKSLLKKYDAKDIKIIAKNLDGGYTTLKNNSYIGDDLHYYDDEYMSVQPKEIIDKLRGKYYSLDIEIRF